MLTILVLFILTPVLTNAGDGHTYEISKDKTFKAYFSGVNTVATAPRRHRHRHRGGRHRHRGGRHRRERHRGRERATGGVLMGSLFDIMEEVGGFKLDLKVHDESIPFHINFGQGEPDSWAPRISGIHGCSKLSNCSFKAGLQGPAKGYGEKTKMVLFEDVNLDIQFQSVEEFTAPPPYSAEYVAGKVKVTLLKGGKVKTFGEFKGICGEANKPGGSGRLYGGTKLEPHMYPWIVLIRAMNKTGGKVEKESTGTLVSRKTIIAQSDSLCTDPRFPENTKYGAFEIRLGIQETINKSEEPYCRMKIYRKIEQDHIKAVEFDSDPDPRDDTTCKIPALGANVEEHIPSNRPYSWALIILKECVPYSFYISPVCLPDSGHTQYTGKEFKIAGWGQSETGAQTQMLYKIEAKAVDTNQCIDCKEMSTKNLVCLTKIDSKNSKGICPGDSGIPWMMEKDGKTTLIAVSTLGLTGTNGTGSTTCNPPFLNLGLEIGPQLKSMKKTMEKYDDDTWDVEE